MSEDALFDMEAREPLLAGDRVRLQTMWGEEGAVVVEVGQDRTFPVATVVTDSGDRVTVSVALVRK